MTERIAIDPTSGGPPFAEPWQAHAFAMVVQLHESGLFTWREWTETLGEQIAVAGDADHGDTYYALWLIALETIVTKKGAASVHELQRTARAWDHAARRTLHGKPIELNAKDFRD